MSAFSRLTRREVLTGLGAAGAASLLPHAAFAAVPADTPLHGISAFGDLKYPADFRQFDYASPEAPKGGRINYAVPNWVLNQSPQTFDTLNTFVLQGNAPPRMESLYDGLMTASLDEPDSLYGALAESIAVSPDRNRFTFVLRPEARFSDGAPVTAADAVFTYRTLKEKGHPSVAVSLREVVEAVAVDARTFRLVFSGKQSFQDTLGAFTLAILPEAFFAARDFERTGLDVIPGSGPKRIGRMEVGRFIEYETREDYWAKDMPFARGLDHFQTVRIDFFRDRQTALESFKKGEITFREEFTPRSWAKEYGFPAVGAGRVVRREFSEEIRPKFQCWALNQRRSRFADPRVRRAINLCFDFEWTNANLFFGLRTHSNSHFEGSVFEATGRPSPAELTMLEPLRAKIPEEVFGEVWMQPVSDGSGNDRKLLRDALNLFSEAGWTRRGSSLVNAAGEAFRIEYLINDLDSQQRYGKFFDTLRRIGIDADFRLVDEAQYQDRQQRFDYDMILAAFSFGATPTRDGLGFLFGSRAKDVPGSYNLPGMADPAIDALIGTVGAAKTRDELTTAMLCLDRVLRARLDWIPNISAGVHRVAYWDMFGFKEPKPDFGFPVEQLWWYDEAKAKAIGRA